MINDTARATALSAVALAALLAATGCSAGATGSQQSAAGSTLNLGSSYQPSSLDPGQSGTTNTWSLELAYDPLIYQAPDGSLQPRLATSWNFVGTGNTVFELHLRPGVKFSDGTPLTADVVKANLDRFRKTPATAPFLGSIGTVSVTGPQTVRLDLSAPDPSLPTELSEYWGPGDMVSGPAVAAPQRLATQTFGAGPYLLDTAQSVSGDHYTYTPNPYYWNKSVVHYSKVVLKILPNANTALAALRTGQVDAISGSPGTDTAARAAGFQVVSTPQTFVGLALADRTGSVTPALGDVRVRQAINYAVDRKKIAGGLVGTYGGPTPTEQIVLPGQDGYNGTNMYGYDPAKARQLLSQAGYANGFTLPVVSFSGTQGMTPLLEAMQGDLSAVGVKLAITDTTDTSTYVQDMDSGKFPAYGIAFGQLPVHLMGPQLLLPNAAPFNPFHSTDAQVESLYAQAASAPPAQQAQLDQRLIARIDQQAWFVPVLFQPVSFYARSGVAGMRASRGTPVPDAVEFRPAQ